MNEHRRRGYRFCTKVTFDAKIGISFHTRYVFSCCVTAVTSVIGLFLEFAIFRCE